MTMIRKTYSDPAFQLDKDSREFLITISTSGIDRDNEVVLPKGLKKKNYAGNPVILLNHDYQTLPVGKTLWIKADGEHRLIAKGRITDKTQLGRDVWGLMEDGILTAASVGFVPLEAGPPTEKEIRARPELAKVRNVIRSWEILEWSLVTVPSNPEALMMAVAKGYGPETLKFLNGGTLPAAKDLIARDCWTWPPDAGADDPSLTTVKAEDVPTAKVAADFNIPVDKLAGLPMPKHARRYEAVVAERIDKMYSRFDPADVLKKYLGRVD